MLRLRPSLILRSAHVTDNSLLNRLLPVVGDLQSARNELRWLREDSQKRLPEAEQHAALQRRVERRSRGEPLQYILGSTYFGGLVIKCRKNVFIPRPETAAAVSYLVKSLVAQTAKRYEAAKKTNGSNSLLATGESDVNDEAASADARSQRDDTSRLLQGARMKPSLKVFDLCYGSGCIPLLFWHDYYKAAQDAQVSMPNLEILGFEMSEDALSLARENHEIIKTQQSEQAGRSQEALKSLQQLEFVQANVLHPKNSTKELSGLPQLREAIVRHIKRTKNENVSKHLLNNDIWISNPPYISSQSYMKNTEQSVRDFEPKAALVPPQPSRMPSSGNDGDRFHQDILEQASSMRVKVVLLEVEDTEQAIRVANMAVQQNEWYGHQIWKDDPGANESDQYLAMESKIVSLHGSGEGRSVLVYTRDGARLIGRWRQKSKDMQVTDRTLFGFPVLEKKVEITEGALKRSQGLVGEETEQKHTESKAAIRERQRRKEAKRMQLAQSAAGSSTQQLASHESDTPAIDSRKQTKRVTSETGREPDEVRQKGMVRAETRGQYAASPTRSVDRSTKPSKHRSSTTSSDRPTRETSSPTSSTSMPSVRAPKHRIGASKRESPTKEIHLNDARHRPKAKPRRYSDPYIENNRVERVGSTRASSLEPKTRSIARREPSTSRLPTFKQGRRPWNDDGMAEPKHAESKAGARQDYVQKRQNKTKSRSGHR